MIKTYAGIPYEEIVRRYADDITRLCVVWTQNEEAAKDCFQNTFLKLYMTKKSFREEEHIKAWLFKVARNECRDYHNMTQSNMRNRVYCKWMIQTQSSL